MNGPEWSDERVQTLRGRLAQGLSTASIAREMKVSKNTVTGKISRLHLRENGPGSPIPTGPRPVRVVPLHNPRVTLPPLPSLAGLE